MIVSLSSFTDGLTKSSVSNEREESVVLDVERTEAAERELNRFIESRSKGRKEANAEAALQKAEDRRRRDEYREACRELWAIHLRRLAGNYLAMARDARRRARALETNVKENSA